MSRTIITLKDPFVYHAPTTEQVIQMNAFTEQAKILHSMIKDQGPGREMALALTNLQQARMWFNAGLVLAEPATP